MDFIIRISIGKPKLCVKAKTTAGCDLQDTKLRIQENGVSIQNKNMMQDQ